MSERILVVLLLLLLLFRYPFYAAEGETATGDLTILKSLMDTWKNFPPDWLGNKDPCDDWEGIKCKDSRVTSIRLSSIGLIGQLSEYIGSLSELEILDLSYNKNLTGTLPPQFGELKKLSYLILVGCSFSGPIPDNIGSLQELQYLSLNSNSFSGQIPHSIGNLSKLIWLDLTDNQLEGPIPVSSGSIPGLDKLLNAKHFHLGKNNLSSGIPPQLFSSAMTLIHVLLDSNQLTGSIPSTLVQVQTLQLLRLDSNSLTGAVPPNIKNLTNLTDLYLSNNKLSGYLPNLAGMDVLANLDMSNNSFKEMDFPQWISTLKSLITLKMERTQVEGQVPASLFSLPSLDTVVLKNNKINGTLDIGSNYSKQLRLIDLETNNIESFNHKDEGSSERSFTLILRGNPICVETGAENNYYCQLHDDVPYTTPTTKNCEAETCSSGRIGSPKCICAYPYTGTLYFISPSFSVLHEDYSQMLANSLMQSFESNDLPVDSILLSQPNPTTASNQYLQLTLQVFPFTKDHFNRTEIMMTGFLLSNQTFKPNHTVFGAYYFLPDPYGYFGTSEVSGNSSNIIKIIAVGGSVLVLLLLIGAGAYAFHQKKRAEKAIGQSNPFSRWHTGGEKRSEIPQLTETRNFSYEEVKKYTNNFCEGNEVGSGGYGKVYKGRLPNGQLIAIKRAQKESMQGNVQFKAEIELLSRVHHKNLVSLVGFCYDQGEQMLVYEFVPNGSLKDALLGKSGIRLNWIKRLKVALGAARGLAYLHEHANPPIIHRDIKSNNILLDHRLNAKVADFGLSKSMLDSDKDHVTTQVKGTMGYMDPEYYTSQQLTEKSDVFSFGVVMLELMSARRPIERGKYIVKEVKNALDRTKELFGLHQIIDPAIIGLGEGALTGFDKFVDVAMKCVEDSTADRPRMSDVVREIENLLHSPAAADDDESPSISSTYEGLSSTSHPHSTTDSFDHKNANDAAAAGLLYPKVR